VTRILILADRFFSLPWSAFLALLALLLAIVLVLARARVGAFDRRVFRIAALAVVVTVVGTYGSYKVFRRVSGMLGRHLPKVTLLAPKAGDTLGNTVELRAHATDLPGALGPIAAVRDVEFWLYHPSFVEQHAGNRESKVFLGSVSGPTPDDRYETSWTCSNPYTPERDGDHSGGAGTRTYVLANDGRPYSIQAHGLDDEWRAKPGRPGYSERVTVTFTPCPATTVGQDWRSDWELAEGLALDIDSEGYRFPTSIAFVPQPGPGPKDPFYFVTELRGAIKVVTNDRSVYTFADNFFRLELPYELPNMRAEIGLGAVHLDAEHGYVFASFGYQDDEGRLHNDIIRFQSTPGTFSLTPTGNVRFTDVFAEFPSSRSHQIGHMAVHDGALYVAVGDALQSSAGRDLASVLGKVLRMSLDGKPVADNPFFSKAAQPQPRDYVWAYGLRNPFGLVLAEGRLFAAENGPGVDRFIAIERGKNYGYDGTDWSMGLNALAVFAPSVGPSQAAWLPADAGAFPKDLRSAFYLTFGGSVTTPPGPGYRGERSVVRLPFDTRSGGVVGNAQPILRYRGAELQMPVGIAFGPDGLYVVPIFPVRDGTSGILRVSYDPTRTHPARIDRDESPVVLLATRGCNGCHASYEGRESVGPSLDPPALVARTLERLASEEYRRSVLEVDALDDEPYVSYRAARAEVLAAEGRERVRRWLKYRILEPRFDTTTSLMPNQGISAVEADRIATYLVENGWGKTPASDVGPGWIARIENALPRPRYRHFVVPFVLGLAIGAWGIARRRS
jgi:hypothetical protein